MITRTQVPEQQRLQHTAKVFGLHFPLHFEPVVYAITENITEQYGGGYWEFYSLSNGGFYMALDSDSTFEVSCENGYEGELSADALGITVCLYAYSHLSFSNTPELAEICTEQYYWLRNFMLEHPEAEVILRAID